APIQEKEDERTARLCPDRRRGGPGPRDRLHERMAVGHRRARNAALPHRRPSGLGAARGPSPRVFRIPSLSGEGTRGRCLDWPQPSTTRATPETQMTFPLIVTFAFFAPVVATVLGNIAGLRAFA